MILQTSDLNSLHFDLCVVGTGPAGIIVALEYSSLHPESSVLLIEYGTDGENGKNRLDDTIKIAYPQHHHEPYECTNKGLGGTSITWGGRCVMYDEIDFIERPVVQGGCTWDPSFLAASRPFIPRTSEYFECGSGDFVLHGEYAWEGESIAEGFIEGDVRSTVVERWSMPTHFGERYRAEIEAKPNLFLVFGVEAYNFSRPSPDGTIDSLDIREVGNGLIHTVRACRFVLAAGTQETTRILLRNKQVFGCLGCVPEALGKYYQGHMSGKIASVVFHRNPKKTQFGLLRDGENIYVRRRFQLDTDVIRKHNLLNTAIWLDNPLYHDPDHRSGSLSMFYLAMITPVLGSKLAPRAIANSITKGKIYKIHRHLWNVIKDFPNSFIQPALVFYRRYCVKRKLPQIFLYNPENTYALHFHTEQVPVPENRMCLADDGETLEIHYRPTDAECDSVIRTHEILDEWLRKCGCGHLQYWFPKESLRDELFNISRDGIHQTGTTRIADSPNHGVVDRNLKVWGTSNLYVCSGSVLPTSGQANPTYFTGVLAVRLANHL